MAAVRGRLCLLMVADDEKCCFKTTPLMKIGGGTVIVANGSDET